ncbi:hypothetical protein JKP88DRAFT_273766 [Tribonema minus]|uniref:Uncharacterized protein n=1 Tax=Tribonema minus TaxID=303371 RepID=A0A835YR44_9STRA|nr:hypothetical protein JKP88DRAFT_273766 [Tribonema minus]
MCFFSAFAKQHQRQQPRAAAAATDLQDGELRQRDSTGGNSGSDVAETVAAAAALATTAVAAAAAAAAAAAMAAAATAAAAAAAAAVAAAAPAVAAVAGAVTIDTHNRRKIKPDSALITGNRGAGKSTAATSAFHDQNEVVYMRLAFSSNNTALVDARWAVHVMAALGMQQGAP